MVYHRRFHILVAIVACSVCSNSYAFLSRQAMQRRACKSGPSLPSFCTKHNGKNMLVLMATKKNDNGGFDGEEKISMSSYERIMQMAAASGKGPSAGAGGSSNLAINTLLEHIMDKDDLELIRTLDGNPDMAKSSGIYNMIQQAKGANARNPHAADNYMDQLKRGSRSTKREQTKRYLQEQGFSDAQIEARLNEEFDSPVALVKSDGTVGAVVDLEKEEAQPQSVGQTAGTETGTAPAPTRPEFQYKKQAAAVDDLSAPKLSYSEQLRLAREAKGQAPPPPISPPPTVPPTIPTPTPPAPTLVAPAPQQASQAQPQPQLQPQQPQPAAETAAKLSYGEQLRRAREAKATDQRQPMPAQPKQTPVPATPPAAPAMAAPAPPAPASAPVTAPVTAPVATAITAVGAGAGAGVPVADLLRTTSDLFINLANAIDSDKLSGSSSSGSSSSSGTSSGSSQEKAAFIDGCRSRACYELMPLLSAKLQHLQQHSAAIAAAHTASAVPAAPSSSSAVAVAAMGGSSVPSAAAAAAAASGSGSMGGSGGITSAIMVDSSAPAFAPSPATVITGGPPPAAVEAAAAAAAAAQATAAAAATTAPLPSAVIGGDSSGDSSGGGVSDALKQKIRLAMGLLMKYRGGGGLGTGGLLPPELDRMEAAIGEVVEGLEAEMQG